MPRKDDHDAALEDFQRRFSEFMAKESGEGKPVADFILFYLGSNEDGGVIQSFGSTELGLAYAAHTMSNVLRHKHKKTKAYLTADNKVVGQYDIEEGYENEPN